METEAKQALKTIGWIFAIFVFSIFFNIMAAPDKKIHTQQIHIEKTEVVEKKGDSSNFSYIVNTVGLFFLAIPFLGMVIGFFIILRKSKEKVVEYAKPQDKVVFR